MKKVFLGTLLFTTVCWFSSSAQTPYYDGSLLRSFVDTSSGNIKLTKEVRQLLGNYYGVGDTSITPLFINNRNPFLKGVFIAGDANAGIDASSFSPKNLGKALGNVDVTNVVDGLAKFLVQRAKEELSLAFFEKFKSDLDKEQYKDLRILLPQTYGLLKLIDTRIYQYAAYLTDLRDAFIADMKDLGYNLPVAMETGTLKKYFSDHPELKTVFSLASQVSSIFLPKDTTISNPGKLIEALDPDHYFGAKSHSDSLMNGSVKTLQLLSWSLQSAQSGRYWVPGDSLLRFVSDNLSVRLYLGLIYPRAGAIYFEGNTSLATLLDDMANQYDKRVGPFVQGIKDFSGLVGGFEDYLKYKNGQRNKDTTALYHYTVYTKTIDAISTGLGLVKTFKPDFSPEFMKFLPSVKILGDIYVNVDQNKFTLAVLSVVRLFDSLKAEGVESKFLQRLSTYGTFVAEVAQAKTSDEVKDIIEQTVLPVGSASIKKNSRFNIAINAYLGGFWGNELMPDNGVKRWAQTAGVTAPIGVAFSKPIFIKNKSYGSISLYGSLFDLGAVASFRFKDTTTESLPKLTLQNIFAPGVGIVYGLPKLPLSVGYMYQWGPQLRTITDTEAQLNTGGMNKRWFFFLAVDIPLLNIYNKPR